MQTPVPYRRLSGFYFFYFSTLGAFLPFWGLYLENESFSSVEIGELSALMMGTKIIAPNIWGWIADHTGKSLRIIRISSFFAMLLFAGFLFKSGYVWFALITIGFSFFWNAALPQFEVTTLFHLRENSHHYSRIRLWGSIGFISAVLAIGKILDLLDITILPLILCALLSMIWLITIITPETRTKHHGDAAVGMLDVIRKPEVIAFFVVYMLLQIAHGPYYVFFSIYLSHHDYSPLNTAWLWALGVSAEVILFIFMGRLLKRFSLRNILLVSIFLSIVRWLLIAWQVQQLPLLLFAQLLHAASFGSSHVVAIHMVHRYFDSRHQGKGQALYSSLSFGVGGMLGSLYSGYFWIQLGPQIIYSLAAFCCVIAIIITSVWVGKEKNIYLT
jgi:PPP family 3-phenylpropionic acid transporter